MHRSNSQELNVPPQFWGQITECEAINDISKPLVRFHLQLLNCDMGTLSIIQNEIVDSLRRIFFTRIAEIKSTPSSKSDVFTRVALVLTGSILASAQHILICERDQKELAVYLGVIATKKLSGTMKAPKGFQTHRMLRCLCRFFSTRYSSNSVEADTLTSNDSETDYQPIVFPSLVNGKGLSSEMMQTLRRGTMDWELTPSGNFMNYIRPFDDRTREWDEFLKYLLSSPFADEEMGIFVHPDIPHDPIAAAASSKYLEPVVGECIISSITKSQFCVEVSTNTPLILTAKLFPVKNALPFVMSLFNCPPAEVYENRFPKGSYMATVLIYFENWRIEIDTYRH